VTPLTTVTIYPQVTGPVVAVHYREGSMVKRGDALIDIDPAPYQSTLDQALGTEQHDKGLLAQARIDLHRYQDAFARNAIAKQQVDDQEQLVIQDEGTLKADAGLVAYDRVQVAYCHIIAPIAGLVGLRLVDPGNTVFSGSGTTLMVITQMQPTTVVFPVAEDDLPRIQEQLHQNHILPVDAYDRSDEHKIEAGTLTALDNQIDTATGTVKFRAEFQNAALALYPNQFVNARLLVQILHKQTLIPTFTVQHNGADTFVYMVKDDSTVAVQPVVVVTQNDRECAVTGLDTKASIATSGFDRLENGVHVEIKKPTDQSRQPNESAGDAAKDHDAGDPGKDGDQAQQDQEPNGTSPEDKSGDQKEQTNQKVQGDSGKKSSSDHTVSP